MAAVAVKPYLIAFRFFDQNNTLIHQLELNTDGARDLPVCPIGGTLQVNNATGDRFLGTVSDVETFIEVDNANLVYRQYITCKNSHPV